MSRMILVCGETGTGKTTYSIAPCQATLIRVKTKRSQPARLRVFIDLAVRRKLMSTSRPELERLVFA